MGERVIKALAANPLFISAAIPRQIFPPLFNRYGVGQHFGVHVDNAVRGDHLTGMRIRTDLSVTLFLSEPDEYDGGELIVEDYYGSHEVKLPAGQLVLYPATSLHTVTPITRGARSASFFWLQSMIRDAPRAQHDLRSRQRDSGARRSRLGRNDRRGREAHRPLSQSHSLLGRGMMNLLRTMAAVTVATMLSLASWRSPSNPQRTPPPAGSGRRTARRGGPSRTGAAGSGRSRGID